MSYKHYPMCGGHFFKWAFEELGHEVFSVGEFSGDTVPWEGNPRFPKYVFPPDLETPKGLAYYPLKEVIKMMPWKPDLIFQVDAGFYLPGRLDDVPNAMFATDPHFLDYTAQYNLVDFFFNPQPSTFAKYPKSIFLPWAYDPNIHKNLHFQKREYDIGFIGLLYDKRRIALEKLSEKYKVSFRNAGVIYDECTQQYNNFVMAFNWSSNDDIPMRIFEGMAYGCVVLTNKITGLEKLFEHGKNILVYSNEEELYSTVEKYLNDRPALVKIALQAEKDVKKHTYKANIEQVLKEVFK